MEDEVESSGIPMADEVDQSGCARWYPDWHVGFSIFQNLWGMGGSNPQPPIFQNLHSILLATSYIGCFLTL